MIEFIDWVRQNELPSGDLSCRTLLKRSMFRYLNEINGRVMEIQDRKREMIAAAFNEKKVQQSKQARLADLHLLLSGPREPAPAPADSNAPIEIVDLVG